MNKGKDLYRVGVLGSYGGLNMGDEAILHSIITQLRNSLPVEFTVFSRNPEDTLHRHHVEHAIGVRKLTKTEVIPEIQKLDLLILGGGGILFDPEIKIFLREVRLALDNHIPVMVYAVGAGPLHDHDTVKLLRECLNRVSVVTVRERNAARLLEDIGVTQEIIVTADPALLLRPEPLPDRTLEHEYIDSSRRLVGMSVREPGAAAPDMDVNLYHSLLANTADFIVDRFDADILFVPMERKVMDMQHSHAIISRMLRAQRAWVLMGEYSCGQLLSVIGHLQFAVGMRLHFLIYAALQGVPFVALPYASKVEGFLESLNLEVPPVPFSSSGQLIAYIDQVWDRRSYVQEQIQRAIPGLQKLARETNSIAVRLLEGNYKG
ncbi:MAG: polysaccharide pyruvyl transferase family protein [bacterium]